MKNFLTVLSFALVLSSCSTMNHTYRANSIQDRPVLATDVVVDVKVDLNKKVVTTSSKRNTVELAKSEAYYKAITENNVDIIVDPIFEVKTSDKFLFFGGRSSAKLTGFAGYYINPRTKTESIKELKIVETMDIHKFNNIYFGTPFPVNNIIKINEKSKTTVITSGVKSSSTTVSTSTNESTKKVKSKYGFKVASATNTVVTDNGDEESTGLAIGITYDSNPNEKLGLKTELMYSFNDEANHFSVPFLAKYSISKNFKLLLGPSLTHVFNSDYSIFSVGIDYGLSYDLGNTLFLDLRYSKGINNIGDNYDAKYNVANFGIGYRF